MMLYKCNKCSWSGTVEMCLVERRKGRYAIGRHMCPECLSKTFKGAAEFMDGWHAMTEKGLPAGEITHVRLENTRVYKYAGNWQKHRLLVTHFRMQIPKTAPKQNAND